MKKIALFIPCFIDTIYPNVAKSTYKFLQSYGYTVEYPINQSCCGQPYANSGLIDTTKEFANNFLDTFSGYDYIVAPSASCVAMVKHRYRDILPPSEKLTKVENSIFEFTEFVHDIIKPSYIEAKFNAKVGLHQSCHGLRELNLATPSEFTTKKIASKAKALLEMVEGLEIVELQRADECCGFGGTFSINESDISIAMGKDRLNDHLSAGADYIVGYDNSCLMHLEGIAKAQKKDIKMLHISEVLLGESL